MKEQNNYYLYYSRTGGQVIGGTMNSSLAEKREKSGKYLVVRCSEDSFYRAMAYLNEDKKSSIRHIKGFLYALCHWIAILALLLIFVFGIYMRYQACMEIFDSFWYCALR